MNCRRFLSLRRRFQHRPSLRPRDTVSTTLRCLAGAVFLTGNVLAGTALAQGPIGPPDRLVTASGGEEVSLLVLRDDASWHLLDSSSTSAPSARGAAHAATERLPLERAMEVTAFHRIGDPVWIPAAGEGSLALLRRDDASTIAVPTPATTGSIVRGAVVIAPRSGSAPGATKSSATGPSALLWLEGDSEQGLAVRAARRVADGWEAPVTVSPPGPGTQIALDAVALADGSWLAVWAAYDGEDDEILWSRFDGSAWSSPRALTDDTEPDVTPQLHATDDGALVVWSGYDGQDYRLSAAHFSPDTAGGAFSAEVTFGGRGASAPRFADTVTADAATPLVLYRQAVPRGWAVTELGADAAPRRTTHWAGPFTVAPWIASADARGVRLETLATGEGGEGMEKAGQVLRWR